MVFVSSCARNSAAHVHSYPSQLMVTSLTEKHLRSDSITLLSAIGSASKELLHTRSGCTPTTQTKHVAAVTAIAELLVVIMMVMDE